MSPRIRNTKQAAQTLGMTARAFLALREDAAFPKPIQARGHHLWWDMKAIEIYFDKQSAIQPVSIDYHSIIMERLNGSAKNAIPS